jgi:SHS2 domain-containing protein
MLKKFEILEHPADIGIRGYGNDLRESFESAAEGLYSIMFDSLGISYDIVKTVTIESIDPEALLVKWLNEILYLFDTEEFIGNIIKVNEITQNDNNCILNAVIKGQKYSKDKFNFIIGVKAVTFHQLLINTYDDGVTVQVFFDV